MSTILLVFSKQNVLTGLKTERNPLLCHRREFNPCLIKIIFHSDSTHFISFGYASSLYGITKHVLMEIVIHDSNKHVEIQERLQIPTDDEFTFSEQNKLGEGKNYNWQPITPSVWINIHNKFK